MIGFITEDNETGFREKESEKSILELFPEYKFVILASIKSVGFF